MTHSESAAAFLAAWQHNAAALSATYDPAQEHDACGVGFVVNVNGSPSHQIVSDGITILKNLEHRGAVGGDSKTGDGAGMLTDHPLLLGSRWQFWLGC